MTIRPMRRKDRTMTESDALDLLRRGEYGFLSTVGADGLPYGVPLSYVFWDGAVYVHCARVGRKVDNIRFCRDVSFTVVGETRPVYAKNFTTYYASVMVFGSLRAVEDADEQYRALYALAEKYLPDHLEKADADIRASLARTAVYRLDVTAVTGKAKTPRPA